MRKRSKRVLLSLLLCVSLLLSLGTGIGPISGNGEAQAADSTFEDLDQDAIVAALGAGWNYGNQLEATDSSGPKEDAWAHVMMKEEMMRSVARAGFKSVRIPVSWLNLIGPAPDYKLDETRLARLQQVIDWALKYKLYVIMNIHGDGYSSVSGGWILPEKSDEQQEVIKEKFAKVWEQLADYFKDYDQHLIFESMNEIGADTTEKSNLTVETIRAVYKNINDYNQIFLDTIRQTGGNNDKRWVLVPGMNTNIEYTAGYDSEAHSYLDYGFKIPEDTYLSEEVPEGEKRVMVSVHYYSPWGFCGQEDYLVTQWGDEADSKKSVGYQSEDYMTEVFKVLKDTFTSKGYPVVIGEYGSIDKSQTSNGDPENPEFRKYYAYRLCSEAKANGLVPVYWDNGWNGAFGYALFDRETLQVTQQDIINGIMNVYAGNTRGTATGIKMSEKYLRMESNDDSHKLSAEITPATSTDMISWSSSDTSVASVSYVGTVRPKGVGTCIITATAASGVSDYCIVEVTEPENLKLALYAGNSNTWKTLEGDQYCVVKRGGGGTFTISMTYDKALMSKLNTLFLKDVTVERGIDTESVVKELNVKVDKVTFNGKKVQITDGKETINWEKFIDPDQPLSAEGQSPAVDLCFMNYWYDAAMIFGNSILAPPAGGEKAEVFLKKLGSSDQCYDFMLDMNNTAYVNGDNTLTMTVTITDPVFDENKGSGETIPVTSLKLSNESLTLGTGWRYNLLAITEPANTTEKVVWFSENPKVATVDKDGMITALTKGSAVIHGLTVSGQDVTCQVTVADDDGTLGTPTPDMTPAPTPSGTDNTPAPGGTDNTPAPGGTNNTPAPGGSTGDKNGGTNVTPTPNPNNNVPTKVTVKKVTLSKVKSPKKKTVQVVWKKLSGVTGYEVWIGTNKKVTKGKKVYTIKKAKTVKKTIKKLKSKKKYFVKIRAYKTVNGKKNYGAFSKVKNVKVK